MWIYVLIGVMQIDGIDRTRGNYQKDLDTLSIYESSVG